MIRYKEGGLLGAKGIPTEEDALTSLSPHADYDKPWCWQYDIRKKNLETDCRLDGISKEQLASMTVHDFEFRLVKDKLEQQEMIKFIKRHEWLGTISQFTTHWFGAYYKGTKLAGVILMNQPNAFSKMLGNDTPQLERLISRGACISWSPKCLASHFMMWCINYMIQHTQYRLFTAYSDVEAKELGTIYQSCNFYYLGRKSGSTKGYKNPYTGKFVSDRVFRARSFYKKYAFSKVTKTSNFNAFSEPCRQQGTLRVPSSWQKFNVEHGYHPTQKPVALMEYLIRTYTNEGETVLDNCMGSGTTGVACVNTKRKFIGIELDGNYFKIAEERIKHTQPPLF